MKRNVLVFGWFMWFIGALFYALDYFQHSVPSVIIGPISKSLGLNIIHVGDVMSVYFPLYAISQLPAGYLLDKYGTKKVLSISCLIVSLGLVVTAFSTGYSSLLTGRIFIAVGSGSAFIGALKIAADWLPSRLFPLAVGMVNTIGVLGGVCSQSLFAWFLKLYKWQTSLIVIAFLGFALAAVILLFLKNRKQNGIKSENHSNRLTWSDLKVLKTPKLWFLSLYAGIMVGTVVNAFGELYGVIFLQYNYHVTNGQAALITSLIFIGIGCGGPVHGIIAGMLKKKKSWMIISNVATTVLFGSLVLMNTIIHVWMLYIIYFLLGFFVSSMLLSFAMARDSVDSKMHGMAIAFVNMFIGLCGAFFQLFIGRIIVLVNGSPVTVSINPNSFIIGFICLLIPLAVSFICLLLYREKIGSSVKNVNI
ncbi:MAG: MFS transporter [bacterium]|nr:MFS transporter [bacterium]